MTPEDRERYEVISIHPRHKPMSQITGPRSNIVIVLDTVTGKRIAIDYMRTAHKNLHEALRILKEEEFK